MIVLMISDIDICFSVLFAVQVLNLEGFWRYGAAIHGIGILTYAAGVLVFGPRQKLAVVKMVKEIITRHQEQCLKPDNNPLTLNDKVGSIAHVTFAALQANEEDYEICKQGLANYNLMQLWAYCEAKNAKNTTERKHGVPFFRVARFGFVSEPTPKDLACILNANTLYTVSTGTWQLVFGAIVIALLGELRLKILIPLGVSAISFLLTVCNVVMDFGHVLSIIEGERLVRERQMQKSESERVKAKDDVTKKRDQQLKKIDRDFQKRTGASDLVEKGKIENDVMNQYHLAIQVIEDRNLDILECEVMNYRERLHRVKMIDGGKMHKSEKNDRENAVQEFREKLKPLEEAKRQIDEHADKQMSEVDPNAGTPEEFEAKMEKISSDRTKRLKVIDKQLASLTERFAHSAGPQGAEP
jgi:hypothetical protein